jgi:hypothetical protein
MVRIKVTGFINLANLGADELDLSDPSGLSSRGEEAMNLEFNMLENITYERDDSQ